MSSNVRDLSLNRRRLNRAMGIRARAYILVWWDGRKVHCVGDVGGMPEDRPSGEAMRGMFEESIALSLGINGMEARRDAEVKQALAVAKFKEERSLQLAAAQQDS